MNILIISIIMCLVTIANENDGKPRLELTWYDAPDIDNLWDATEFYIVVKLTPTEM